MKDRIHRGFKVWKFIFTDFLMTGDSSMNSL
jgi:hypothetical protein